ncbi:MAG TPA: hypothetical protein PKA64_26890 [Myxococcota bacterium]|nr:hypothetical protein [Myxococcota bacterium]
MSSRSAACTNAGRAARRVAAWMMCICVLPSCVVITEVRQPCGHRGEPTVELGLGARGWVPLPEDGRVPWERGPQGGVHVTGALRVARMGDAEEGEEGAHLLLTWVLERRGEIVGGFEGGERSFRATDDGAVELYGEHLMLDASQPEEVEGQPLVMRVEVDDACGRMADAAAPVELVGPDVVPPP